MAPRRTAADLLCRQTLYCVWLNTNRFVTFRYLMFLCLKARNKQKHGVLLLIVSVPPFKSYVSFPTAEGRATFALGPPRTGTKPSLGQRDSVFLRTIEEALSDVRIVITVSRVWIRDHVEQGCTCIRFEGFTAMTMKNIAFWDVAPCGSGLNRRFGGTYRLHLQGRWITRDHK
jgi:hypothetical protein